MTTFNTDAEFAHKQCRVCDGSARPKNKSGNKGGLPKPCTAPISTGAAVHMCLRPGCASHLGRDEYELVCEDCYGKVTQARLDEAKRAGSRVHECQSPGHIAVCASTHPARNYAPQADAQDHRLAR